MNEHLTISQRGLDMIKGFEGSRALPYLDSAGIATIGVGHAIRHEGDYVRDLGIAHSLFPKALSDLEIENLLLEDLEKFIIRVREMVKVPLTQNQFDALVSFDFNTGALGRSTLLKLLNKGAYHKAAGEFAKWNKETVNGQLVVSRGLTNRRAKEKEVFERDVE